MVLWTEPLGDERLSESSHFTLPGLYGDWLHQKVRRFIVIAEAEQHCVAMLVLYSIIQLASTDFPADLFFPTATKVWRRRASTKLTTA